MKLKKLENEKRQSLNSGDMTLLKE